MRKNKSNLSKNIIRHFGTTAVDLHPRLFSLTEQEKKVYWSNPHPSVILSSENGRADVVKEGASKFIEKNYTGYTASDLQN